MKIINEKIKEKLAKGVMLLTISGALVAKNPVASNNGNTVVYAAETLESKQSKALKNLEKVYKYYSKSYYTEKEYTKLTKYYNKGVKAIKACKTKTSVTETYNEYKELLNSVKPSILVKYQKKMEKSLLKSYKSLIKKNSYSDYNLTELENIKDEGIEKIYASKTKSKSKKAKTSYVKKLKGVTTLLEETRLNIVNYILDNKDLSKTEKQAIIEQINNLEKVEDIVSVGEEYGYSEEEVVIVDETITVEQVEDKIKELCKKYPKYDEEEIRCMVAAANMDYVKDEDILTIFDAKDKEEMEEKAETVRVTMIWIIESYKNYLSNIDGHLNIDYPDTLKTYDLFINPDMKAHAKFMWENTNKKLVAKRNYDLEDYPFEDVMETCHSILYFYNTNSQYTSFCYDETGVIPINDERLNGVGGYIINSLHLETYSINNYYYQSYLPKNSNYDTDIDKYMEKYENCIMNRVNKKIIKK